MEAWHILVLLLVGIPAGVWGVLMYVNRDDPATQKLARRLIHSATCPECGHQPMAWRGKTWAAEPAKLRREPDFIFHCPQCGGDYPFDRKGKYHPEAEEVNREG